MVQVNTPARGPVPGPKASGANSMAAGSAAEASGNDSTALGNNAKATANNSIALGDSSVADRANSLSVGSRGHERQITNVADATQGTDAVNLRQMNEGLRVTEENARHYTDQRFNRLHKKIEDLDDDLSAGIAGAMAMAALPPPYQAGGTSTGIGAATYRGQSALAFGLSSISKDGKWSTRLSGNMNTAGDAGAAVGVGYNW
ncbi:YadA family autotransporter adhesin [Pseudomonas aeruginosa]|nr:YadA family autotransporter adhesin [Pseudomonas aeruginosa]